MGVGRVMPERESDETAGAGGGGRASGGESVWSFEPRVVRSDAKAPARAAFAEVLRPLGREPLTEPAVAEFVRPLFSRVLARGGIYLASHSLGRPPDRSGEDVVRALDCWYEELDGAWPEWLGALNVFRMNTATLIGCGRGDAVVPREDAGAGVRSVLSVLPAVGRKRPARVLACRGVSGVVSMALGLSASSGVASVTWLEPGAEGVMDGGVLAEALGGSRGGVDLVVMPLASFVTGALMGDARGLIVSAQGHGAMVVLDVSEAAGVAPMDVSFLGPEFVVGGSHRYTRGGPGAGWLAVRGDLLDGEAGARLVPTDAGALARRDPLGPWVVAAGADLAAGGDAWLGGAGALLTAYRANAGLELTLALGVERLWRYRGEQQRFLLERLGEAGVGVASSDAGRMFVRLPASDAAGACARLRRAGVTADALAGHVRLGVDVLTTRREMAEASALIARVL